MMFLLAGLQLIPSAGRSITTGLILSDGSVAQGAFDPAFLAIGRYRLWDVAPLPVVIVAIIAIVAWFFMERTRANVFRRQQQRERPPISPAPVQRYRVAYVISGALAALGGVFVAAAGRTPGDVARGSSLLLDSVAASDRSLQCSISAAPMWSARSPARSSSGSSSTVSRC